MSVIGKLISLVSGRNERPADNNIPPSRVACHLPAGEESQPAKAIGLVVTTDFPEIRISLVPSVSASDSINTDNSSAEFQEEMRRYQYAFEPCSKPRSEFTPWWTRESYETAWTRRREALYAWLTPFMSAEIARHPELHSALRRGAVDAKALPPALRTIIREKRKNKEPHASVLHALYGSCVLVDFVESLRVEYGTFFYDMTQFVDFTDLVKIRCDYSRMGYRNVQTLKPNDVKWLVSEFGEPSVHLSYNPLWNSLRRDAVRWFCRSEIRRNNSRITSEADVETALPGWLQERISFSIRLRNEDRARAAATLARNKQRDTALENLQSVWDSTYREFVVADLETTGLDINNSEILEIAAVRSDSNGVIISQYSALVRITKPVPALITELTGISQSEIDREGRPLHDVLRSFLVFLGDSPVFFHNAPFDVKFLRSAAAQSGLKLSNVVRDTLPIARAAWPGMKSHKLETLVKIIDGAPAPTHRALADAKATLAVLMAAREIAGCESPLLCNGQCESNFLS
mgnify:CR=1 FL=1